MSKIPKTLSIAGSDSGGGAGIQADLKTFSALGCYGMSVITALTAQNTVGVQNISGVDPAFIQDQLNAVLDDIGADAVKIGMLHDPEVIEAVADTLIQYPTGPVVLDPVMVAKSGDRLLQEDAITTLKSLLIPHVTVITPNIPEAEVLLDDTIGDEKEMKTKIKSFEKLGPAAVLLKGGHLSGAESPDYLYTTDDQKVERLDGERINTDNTHGTGCTLSSALAAYMARGLNIREATQKAKVYMNQALRAGANKKVGNGKGPVHHFFNWWDYNSK